ncbi:MAG: Lrp/AsnC family transcriptional regulator [Candidatus Kariarchaeaceae archaeon]|jgi:DNA-binding Lrp family transcriptional regulator
MAKLDEQDFEIMELLKLDSQQPLKTLAEKLNSKPSTVHARIKKLEQRGIIKKYSVNLDMKAIGLPLVGFIMLIFEKSETDLDQEEIAQQIGDLARVQEVHLVAGEYDILVKVRARDIEDLGIFVTKDLKMIKGIGSSRTFVSLNIVKEASHPPYPISGKLEELKNAIDDEKK